MIETKAVLASLLGISAAVAVVTYSPVTLLLVALGLTLLVLGYSQKNLGVMSATGVLVYYPLASALSLAVQGPLPFFLSAGALISLLERLHFDMQLERFSGSSSGMDEEARESAKRLSRSHLVDLGAFIVLGAVLAVASLFISGYVAYSTLLAGSAAVLFLILWTYSRR